LSFPTNFAQLAGSSTIIPIPDANAIPRQYAAQNMTAADTVDMLDYYVQAVYKSSPDNSKTPFGCEINGLASLTCGTRRTPLATGEPIRAVGLEGLFTSAPWATGGKELTLSHAEKFYTAQDFEDMKDLGLNTVQISVPTALFRVGGEGHKALLTQILRYVKNAELQAILVLVSTGDEPDALLAAASFCVDHPFSVLGLVLPEHTVSLFSDMITSVRVVAPKLALFIPSDGNDSTTVTAQDKHVYGALKMGHVSTIADIASSSSEEDRNKLFYHEAISCMARSPLEYLQCYRNVPSYVMNGFDLSIDDCTLKGTSLFKDYGQCDRFEETIDSKWWDRHRASYAARQVFAYERGMGWSFATWKLYDDDSVSLSSSSSSSSAGLITKNVVAAGLFPSLNTGVVNVAQLACLNPPENDVGMGDATLSPTPVPPPNCGYGWWNATTSKCDYWIPPPDPTPSPTTGCPICETCSSPSSSSSVSATAALSTFPSAEFTPIQAGGIGAVVAVIVTTILFKTVFKPRRGDYQSIPN
jgi:hypothetical protein